MSRTGWKQIERDAAALINAKRHWANIGEREDAASDRFAMQVKNPKTLSLAELTRLIEEMTIRGIDHGKIPIVVVKQSARRPTPLLVVLPAAAWTLLWDRGLSTVVMDPSPNAFGDLVRQDIRETPGLRKRVAEFVEKSKRRSRRRHAEKRGP